MKEKRIHPDWGINWVWFMSGEFDDENMTVTVLFHDRWHKGDQWPKALEENMKRVTFRFIESDQPKQRTAVALQVGDKKYTILNPANVFSYRDQGIIDSTK